MFFIIFKPKDKHRYTSYTNEIFRTEEDATDYARRSLKKKDKFKIVDYDKENLDKYWYSISKIFYDK